RIRPHRRMGPTTPGAVTLSCGVAIIGRHGRLCAGRQLAQRAVSAMVFEQDNELRWVGRRRRDRLHNARVLPGTAGFVLINAGQIAWPLIMTRCPDRGAGNKWSPRLATRPKDPLLPEAPRDRLSCQA